MQFLKIIFTDGTTDTIQTSEPISYIKMMSKQAEKLGLKIKEIVDESGNVFRYEV